MDLTTLDPDRAFCDTCQIVLSAMYDTLTTVDPANPTEVQPKLATSWEASKDYTTFTFTLDDKAVFSDGSPVEGKDVAWSLLRLRNIKGSGSYMVGGLETAKALGPKQVELTYSFSNSSAPAILASSFTGVLNSDVLEAEGASAADDADKSDKAEAWFFKNSAGSGPYMLKSYEQGASIRLTKNPAYWGSAPTYPSVLIKHVADSSSQLQQLQQGDADIAMQISMDSLGQLKDAPGVTARTVDSYNMVYLALQPGAEGGEVLEDVRVRTAIREGIDYEGLIKDTLDGHGRTQGSPIPNGFPGSDGVEPPVYDPDGAADLLKQAGYPDGFTLTSTYPKMTVYGVDFDVMMQSIQQDLAKIGITLKLRPVEMTQLGDLFGQGKIAMTAVYFAPDDVDSAQYVSYFGMVPDAMWANLASSKGPVVDPEQVRLFADARQQVGAEQAGSYAQLAALMKERAITLPVVNPELVMAHSVDVTGVDYSPCCNLDLAKLGKK